MLSLAIVMLWTAFACAYLVWQQVHGDLQAVGHQPSAVSEDGPLSEDA